MWYAELVRELGLRVHKAGSEPYGRGRQLWPLQGHTWGSHAGFSHNQKFRHTQMLPFPIHISLWQAEWNLVGFHAQNIPFSSLLVSRGLSLCPEIQEHLQNDSLERCWPRPVAHILIQYLLTSWSERDINCPLFRMKGSDGYGKNPCIPKPSSHHYGSCYIMDCFIFSLGRWRNYPWIAHQLSPG